MSDRVSSEQRSQMMAAVRGVNTLPELYVRRQLFAAGFRYRIHAKNLVGKPDIVLPRFRFVVFVYGCFWHGHCCSRGRRPSSNMEFWNAKIDGNIQRDRRTRAALRIAGWSTAVIWECRLESATVACEEIESCQSVAVRIRENAISFCSSWVSSGSLPSITLFSNGCGGVDRTSANDVKCSFKSRFWRNAVTAFPRNTPLLRKVPFHFGESAFACIASNITI